MRRPTFKTIPLRDCIVETALIIGIFFSIWWVGYGISAQSIMAIATGVLTGIPSAIFLLGEP